MLGLGKMGAAMARRLASAGFELTVWNRTRARAEGLGMGRVAGTPAEAVRDAEVVLSSLTGPDAVRQVYLGPDGAVQGASGQLFAEASTAGPDVIAEIEPPLRARGSALLDTPVVGTVTAVESGSLLVLAGGSEADLARARPVLETLGEVRHAGPLGSGARLKLVANGMLGVIALAAGELSEAGERAGLDREVIFPILTRLAPGLQPRRRGYVEGRHSPALFALRDQLKDLDLGLGVFHQAGAPVPVLGLTRELVAEAALTHGDQDISAVAVRYARREPAAAAADR